VNGGLDANLTRRSFLGGNSKGPNKSIVGVFQGFDGSTSRPVCFCSFKDSAANLDDFLNGHVILINGVQLTNSSIARLHSKGLTS
tara:strand:+ start:20 stop:274 length:255 start_codon:yes stop_codon:yes gene_type:complete